MVSIKYRLWFLVCFITWILSENDLLAQNSYKVSLIQAAPGDLLLLIDKLSNRVAKYGQITGSKPWIVRHSQGDFWDLMIIQPVDVATVGSASDLIFSPTYGDELYNWIAYREELFVKGEGEDIEKVSKVFDNNDYFHIEMFVALPGKQKELLAERKMENKYLQDLNRPTNLIFTKLSGGSYDIFTIGGYRSIKHYAESADIPFEEEDEAAKKAGFEGVNFIGSYLRSLISSHHDTLATKVNIEN